MYTPGLYIKKAAAEIFQAVIFKPWIVSVLPCRTQCCLYKICSLRSHETWDAPYAVILSAESLKFLNI